MTPLLEFAAIAVPLAAAVAALLCFGRRRIHRQMKEIAEAAKAGAFKRPMRFRPLARPPAPSTPWMRSRPARTGSPRTRHRRRQSLPPRSPRTPSELRERVRILLHR